MAEHREALWDRAGEALTRRHIRGGHYATYVPDDLITRPIVVSPELARTAARVERAVRRLTDSPGLDSLGRFLLRSEAIASSRIEGLHVSAQQVALAELATAEERPLTGLADNAWLVANNIAMLRRASGELGDCEGVAPENVCALHRALLPDHPQQGLRTGQNWIGGSDWHPLDADSSHHRPARFPASSMT